jgi:signal transduction histidine kinase
VSRENDLARLDVRDTGIGMSPDTIAHAFEPFFRADPARSSHAEGAGLGLSLVKWIADRHGARIEVVSRPNEGSTVTVRLPLATT